MKYASMHDAYHAILNEIRDNGELVRTTTSRSVATNFGASSGRNSLELPGYAFTIMNPRDRLIPCRNADLRYNIANFLWTVAENGNPEHIIHYNPRGKAFLEDSELKCDIPSRLQNSLGGSQLVDAINLLKTDPDSRRAFITLGRPADIHEDNLDFPCPASIHYLIRNGKLNSIVHMRSQSTYGVLPYDVFLFTMMQEAVAVELGVELGTYTHISNSLHIYEDELPKVASLDNCEESTNPMPVMEEVTPILTRSILDAEETIRVTEQLNKTGHPYWDALLAQLIQP